MCRFLSNRIFVLLAVSAILSATVSAGRAQGAAFIYNGQLKQQGQSPNGERDLRFGLFANATNGTAIATIDRPKVALSKGSFSVTLDFGQAFDGSPRWLEISVKNNKGQFVTLKPRQRFMPTPYAIMAGSASNLLGTLPASQLTGILPPGAFGGTYSAPLILNNAANSFTGNGAGLNNVNATKLNGLEAGSLWQLGGNAGINATNFLGTKDFQPLELKVNNQRALRIQPGTNGSPNILGGTKGNYIGMLYGGGMSLPVAALAGTYGATIGGGGGTNAFETNAIFSHFGTIAGGAANRIERYGEGSVVGGGYENRVLDSFSTVRSYAMIGGGASNQVYTPGAVIGGGIANIIGNWGSGQSEKGHTIGGGNYNRIGYEVSYSTIAGGSANYLDAHYTTIAGGQFNRVEWAGNTSGNTIGGGIRNYIQTGFFTDTAGRGSSVIAGGLGNNISGSYSSIPGGYSNSVAGHFSFATGRRAQANHDGTFVYADSKDFDFSSTTENSFSVRSVGGARFVSAIDTHGNPSAGVELPSGGGSWSTLSDRNTKENISIVNTREVLERVAQMPISTWNYKSQDSTVRHIGPMAQDFAAAFQVGEDSRRITTVDADGVALAAIQGLNQVVKEKDSEIQKQAAEIQDLKQRLEKLEQIITRNPGNDPCKKE